MNKQRGRKKKGFAKIYSSVPPEIDDIMREEAARRGLDKADLIREVLMEKFANERQGRPSEKGRE